MGHNYRLLGYVGLAMIAAGISVLGAIGYLVFPYLKGNDPLPTVEEVDLTKYQG